MSVGAIAAMNGLDPAGVLLAGTVLKLPTGAPAPARAAEPAPAQKIVPVAAPEPTATRLGAGDVQSVAAQHGVSPSLATAIAWQESGFNNGMVSSANARGVMQVMPGTWNYVQQNLANRTLDPNSAHDNVTAGVLYLKSLLNQTGGDESAAIAAYYQGLGALRSRGVFDDTKQYVANVQALDRVSAARRESVRREIISWRTFCYVERVATAERPLDLIFLLSEAAHALQTEMTRDLAELGVTPRMHCVLYHALDGEFSQIQLADQCALDKTTMVVTMDALEKAGWPSGAPPPPTGAPGSSP